MQGGGGGGGDYGFERTLWGEKGLKVVVRVSELLQFRARSWRSGSRPIAKGPGGFMELGLRVCACSCGGLRN